MYIKLTEYRIQNTTVQNTVTDYKIQITEYILQNAEYGRYIVHNAETHVHKLTNVSV
jgi:hypothetical protein